MSSDLKATVLSLNYSMPVLATVFVALRLYARKLSKVSLGTDDYLAVAALVCGQHPRLESCSDVSSSSQYASLLTLSSVSTLEI